MEALMRRAREFMRKDKAGSAAKNKPITEDTTTETVIPEPANKENDIITEKPVEEPVTIPEQSKETPVEDPKIQETTTISTPVVRFMLEKSF